MYLPKNFEHPRNSGHCSYSTSVMCTLIAWYSSLRYELKCRFPSKKFLCSESNSNQVSSSSRDPNLYAF